MSSLPTLPTLPTHILRFLNRTAKIQVSKQGWITPAIFEDNNDRPLPSYPVNFIDLISEENYLLQEGDGVSKHTIFASLAVPCVLIREDDSLIDEENEIGAWPNWLAIAHYTNLLLQELPSDISIEVFDSYEGGGKFFRDRPFSSLTPTGKCEEWEKILNRPTTTCPGEDEPGE